MSKKIGIATVSEPGDSCSVFVASGTNIPVGLLFKGDHTYTYANDLTAIQEEMQFTFKKPR